MRCSPNLLVPVMALAASVAALAQTPTYNNVGRTPSSEEIRAWDISISPEGKGLPPGNGTAQEGVKIYERKCASCHGPTGAEGTLGPRLVGGKGTLNTGRPVRTIGSYWPFATTIFDYLRRSMPWKSGEGSLSANEVYALTAFLLYRNDIIKETDVIDAKSLAKIQMPNRNGFIPPRPEWNPRMKRPEGHYPDGFHP